MVSKLLIDDYPIQVLPKLAKEVGLNEAIFLQQLHYWLSGKSAKYKDGKKWIYNTYEDWQKQFPFWSVSTIKRTISSLESKKLIFKGNYNRAGFDKTIWYSVDYDELNRMNQRVGQNEPTSVSNWTDGEGHNELTNTIDYTETTSETNKDTLSSHKIKTVRHKYGEYNNVLLTDEQLSKLKDEYTDYENKIDKLSEYVEITGKSYKNHYATIKKWARNDNVKKPVANKPQFKNSKPISKNAALDEFAKKMEAGTNGL